VIQPGLRVLVVDDNADFAEVLCEFLRESGCVPETAGEGRAGLDLVRSFAPDVILLDLGLPDMSGFDFVQQLRRDPPPTSFVIIAVSGYRWNDVRAQAEGLGIVHHLLKPVDFDTVLATLAREFPDPAAG
jgi:CheY-like chemotaxis protein